MTIQQKRDEAARLGLIGPPQGVKKVKPERVDRRAVVVKPRERRAR